MNSLVQAREYRGWPGNYYDAAVQAWLALPRDCFLPRWIIGPPSGKRDLSNLQRFSQTVHIVPGSYIYNLGFSSPGDAKMQVTDVGTGLTFFDRPTRVTGRYPTSGILPARRIVEAPGELKVEIWPASSTDADVRFVLWIAEPEGARR